MTYLLLFLEFFKTGLFSIGGGLATLPFLYDMADRYPWFTREELANMIAVSESTPGPIGVNMATYVGVKTAGIIGGVLATLALILPSFLIILLIAKMLSRYQNSRTVQSAMSVLRPVSVGLIGAAFLSVLKVSLLTQGAGIKWPALAVGVVLLTINLKWEKLHPGILILLGAAAGIVLGL